MAMLDHAVLRDKENETHSCGGGDDTRRVSLGGTDPASLSLLVGGRGLSTSNCIDPRLESLRLIVGAAKESFGTSLLEPVSMGAGGFIVPVESDEAALGSPDCKDILRSLLRSLASLCCLPTHLWRSYNDQMPTRRLSQLMFMDTPKS